MSNETKIKLCGEALWEAAQNEFAKIYPLQSSYTSIFDFVYEDYDHFYLTAPLDGNSVAAECMARKGVSGALDEILSRLAGRNLSARFSLAPASPSVGQDSNKPNSDNHALSLGSLRDEIRSRLADNTEAPTLRDRYMMAAITGTIAQCSEFDDWPDPNTVIKYAKRIANAALAQRKEAQQ